MAQTLKIKAVLDDLISPKLKTIQTKLKEVTTASKKTATSSTKSFKKMGTSLSNLKTGAVAVTAAIIGIGVKLNAIISESLTLYDAQEKAIAQVEAGLKSTGNTVGYTSKQLQEMSSELQKISLFGDEEILANATAQLLTFTNITGEQFDKTQLAALNLATRLDGDLKSASIQLGKALNDPVANLSALSRSGIQFSDAQKELINSLAETNQLAEAQDIILAELEKQYGGSAEAAALAGTGGLTQLKNVIGDLKEEFGGTLIANVNTFSTAIMNNADNISTVISTFETLKNTILDAFNFDLENNLTKVLDIINNVLTAVSNNFFIVSDAIKIVIEPFKELFALFGDFGGALSIVTGVMKVWVAIMKFATFPIRTLVKGITLAIEIFQGLSDKVKLVAKIILAVLFPPILLVIDGFKIIKKALFDSNSEARKLLSITNKLADVTRRPVTATTTETTDIDTTLPDAPTLDGDSTTLTTDRSVTNITLDIEKIIESGGIVLNTTNMTENSEEITKIVEEALTKALIDATNIKL